MNSMVMYNMSQQGATAEVTGLKAAPSETFREHAAVLASVLMFLALLTERQRHWEESV